jgi:23S rRNA (uracil1939-C5)-methyltransferase
VIFGSETITDYLCGMKYEISPHSFFQINPYQTEKLYNKALELADIGKDDNVMDLYCGIGTISLSAAKKAKSVIGVEIVEQAILNARKNADENNIKNVTFYASDASDLVPKLIENGEKPDIVILDPPRKGSDEKTLSAIIKSNPKRIVYVSCNPATLARDLRFLADNGYETKSVCGVDMFSQTMHIESVALISKR